MPLLRAKFRPEILTFYYIPRLRRGRKHKSHPGKVAQAFQPVPTQAKACSYENHNTVRRPHNYLNLTPDEKNFAKRVELCFIYKSVQKGRELPSYIFA